MKERIVSFVKGKDSIKRLLLGLFWMVEYIVNIWYVKRYFIVYNMNSDFAGDAVFAKHLSDTGHYIFSADWYPTTELYIVHHQLIMVPLFKLFKDYSTVWVMTSVIAFALMSACIFYFMSCFKSSFNKSLLAVILFLNPITFFNLEYSVWFHGYLFYYCLSFIIIGNLCKYLAGDAISKKDVIIILITSFLAGVCGIRMFMIVFVPFVMAYIIFYYNEDIRKACNNLGKMMVASLMSAFIGFVVYYFGLVPRYGGDSVISGIKINSSEIVKDNLLLVPQMIINGLNINYSNTEINLYAILTSFTVLFWAVVFIYTIKMIFSQNEKLRFLAILSASCILLNILFMIMTIGNNTFVESSRYFLLSIFMQIPLFALSIEIRQMQKLKDYILSVVIVLSCLSMFLWCKNKIDTYGSETAVSWRQPYIDYLIDNGYNYGIATYWNANVTIFLSNGNIQVAPVLDLQNYSFFEWNTQKSFKNRTPEFVLLSTDEYENRKELGFEDTILYEDSSVVIISYN
ncbi:MAG: hypothetical protein ACFWTJ_02750 [Lachnoclostridium sp.]|jgi:hypothetical protein